MVTLLTGKGAEYRGWLIARAESGYWTIQSDAKWSHSSRTEWFMMMKSNAWGGCLRELRHGEMIRDFGVKGSYTEIKRWIDRYGWMFNDPFSVQTRDEEKYVLMPKLEVCYSR